MHWVKNVILKGNKEEDQALPLYFEIRFMYPLPLA